VHEAWFVELAKLERIRLAGAARISSPLGPPKRCAGFLIELRAVARRTPKSAVGRFVAHEPLEVDGPLGRLSTERPEDFHRSRRSPPSVWRLSTSGNARIVECRFLSEA